MARLFPDFAFFMMISMSTRVNILFRMLFNPKLYIVFDREKFHELLSTQPG